MGEKQKNTRCSNCEKNIASKRNIYAGILVNCMVMHPRYARAFFPQETGPAQERACTPEEEEDYMLYIKLSHLNDSYKITQDFTSALARFVCERARAHLSPQSRLATERYGLVDRSIFRSFVSLNANKLIYLIVYCLAWLSRVSASWASERTNGCECVRESGNGVYGKRLQ